MAVKANSLTRLEAVVKSKRPVEADPLQGLDPHSCIVEQINLTTIRPHELHRAIRSAQNARLDALDDYMARYDDDTITLTLDEKNFIIIHEQDTRGGILRATAKETFERVDEVLREQAAKNEG